MKNHLRFLLCTTFFVAPMLWAQLPDPLGHWTFDEGSDYTTADVSGNGNNGTISEGGVDWSTDTPTGKGYALAFVDKTGAVHIGDPEILKIVGDITLAAWIKTGPATESWQNIVVKGHGAGENFLRVDGNTVHTGTQIWCGSYNGSDHMVNSFDLIDAELNTWIHVVGTYSTDYQLWSLYINGVLVSAAPNAVGAVSVTDRGWAIGARASADGVYPTERHFQGLIDDVRIYNVALTEEEVGQLYAQTLNAVNDRSRAVPADFTMNQNYPNPFNPQTHIDYEVPHAAGVNISIYNVLGQFVATLVDGVKSPGHYSVIWNGTDHNGSKVAGGVYLAKMVSNDYSATRKLLLLK